jgi:hypothetical protein
MKLAPVGLNVRGCPAHNLVRLKVLNSKYSRTVCIHAHSIPWEVLLQGDARKGGKGPWPIVRLVKAEENKK